MTDEMITWMCVIATLSF